MLFGSSSGNIVVVAVRIPDLKQKLKVCVRTWRAGRGGGGMLLEDGERHGMFSGLALMSG